MKDLVTDIKALQEETLKNLQSSKANNTVRAYKSDLYALTVLMALELCKFFNVSSCKALISDTRSFIIFKYY